MYNLYLIFTLLNLVFIKFILELDHIIIYNKIHYNQDLIEDKQLKFDIALIKSCYDDSSNAATIGFLRDDSSILNQNRINIYKVNLSNFYGYMGCRTIEYVDVGSFHLKLENYSNILRDHGFNPRKLKMITLNSNEVEQIFFLQNDKELWSYDLSFHKFNLEYALKTSKETLIDYVITSNNIYMNNSNNNECCDYIIYLHVKEHDQHVFKKNYIKRIFKNLTAVYASETLELINQDLPIINFFIRSNHLIVVYNDFSVEPEIYKLIQLNNLSKIQNFKEKNKYCEKLNIKLKRTKFNENNNCNLSSNFIGAKLLWDQTYLMHRLDINYGCNNTSYLFNLYNDNYLLSYRVYH